MLRRRIYESPLAMTWGVFFVFWCNTGDLGSVILSIFWGLLTGWLFVFVRFLDWRGAVFGAENGDLAKKGEKK